jgi:hypothetical protein
MSLPTGGYTRLRKAGFLDSEIREFDSAIDKEGKPQPDIDLSSPVWRAVMRSRYEWTIDKIKRGWSKREINTIIKAYYNRKNSSPWDFIKAEYRPARKTDFITALRRRTQAKLRKSGLR